MKSYISNMQEQQQQNIDNMFTNSVTINNLTEKFQPLENFTIVETTKSNKINEICYNNNITKTSPLVIPLDLVKMQSNNLKFYVENSNDNQQNEDVNMKQENTSEHTKDLLLKTTNYSQNNNLNSHYNININNNSNIINNSTISTTTTENNDKSAFNCKTNSDNNLLNNSNLNSINMEKNNYKIESPISQINTSIPQSTILSSSADHEDAYNQRCYVEDVHNYSKKLNCYEFSSKSSNNTTTSSGTDDYETDESLNDELLNMNKIKRKINKKFDIDETDTNKKWLKNIKKRNDNKILKGKIINNKNNNHYDYNNDNNIKEKLIINMKSETPDSGVPDDDDKLTPDHHARRPMNAFLIFCKRHRGIVRDKYKNVENRQITKILGEWWANMTVDEKSCYTNLAKENKDQFLSANPDFKWYKLPAPPLRTLTTRPFHNNISESKQDDDKNENNSHFNEHISLKNNSTSLNYQHQHQQQHHKKQSSPISTKSQLNNVGVFKFADETQMGNLNNLIVNDGINTDQTHSMKWYNSPTHSIISSSLSPINDQSNELQNALSETSDFLCNTITKTNFPTINEPFENMRDYVKKMKNTKSSCAIKRKLPATITNENVEKLLRDNSFSSSEDDGNLINRKLSRSCKGKKYEELVKSGQITILSKKSKKIHNENDNHTYSNDNKNNNYSKDSSSDSDSYNHISPTTPNEFKYNFNTANNHKLHINENKFQSIDNNIIMKKQFDSMIDFGLDNKIMALPAQCFEQYLLKKHESKSKKKINSKRRKTTNNKKQINNIKIVNNNDEVIKPVQTIQEIKEQIVGSQKRKARKESITRRDINAIQTEAKLVNYMEFGGGTTVAGNSDNNNGNLLELCKQENNDCLEINTTKNEPKTEQNFRATDLLILAEVASNVDE